MNDHEIRQALRRRPAPAGFAERVAARAACGVPAASDRPAEAGGSRGRFAAPRIAAAALLALVLGASVTHEVSARRERLAGERARDQLLTALRITGSKIHQVETHLAPND